MTQAVPVTTLPAMRPGGSGRRFLLLLASTVVWLTALVFLGSGISPGLGEPTENDWVLRVLLIAAGIAISVLPVLVLTLPAQRRAAQLVEAVLRVSAAQPTPQLPPFTSWGGPERIFQRLRLTCYTLLAPPLLLLAGSSVVSFFLGEPVAGAVFAGLTLIPLLFLAATWTIPQRLRQGLRQGLAGGQVVALRVERRIDDKALLNGSYRSWFDAVLPGGQHVILRTPLHYPWAAEARGVVDAHDLVLVMGSGGHQGLLLSPARPEDAVWLLGPVPLTRAPRRVLEDFNGH